MNRIEINIFSCLILTSICCDATVCPPAMRHFHPLQHRCPLIKKMAYNVKTGEKRQPRNTHSIMDQPRLGRLVELGSFYYGATDQVNPSENLWSFDDIEKGKRVILEQSTLHNKVELVENFLDRNRLMKVDSSLGLSVIGGLIKTTGKTKFLLDRKDIRNEITVSILIETVTSKEYIPQELKQKIKHENLCKKVGHPLGPTHIVNSVTRGFQGVLSFTLNKTQKEISSNIGSGVGGTLMTLIGEIPLLVSAGIEIDLKPEEKEIIGNNNLKISFSGDAIIDKINNFEEALEAYKQITDIAKTSNVITKFGVDTISNYCAQNETLFLKVSDSLTKQCLRVYNEIEETELLIDDLLYQKSSTTYKDFPENTLFEFKDKFISFKSKWTKELHDILPEIRTGTKNEKELVALINQYVNSPYRFRYTRKFLSMRKKEIEVLNIFLNNQDANNFAVEDSSAIGAVCTARFPYLIRFTIFIPRTDQVLLQYLNSPKDYSENNSWYNNKRQIQIIANKYIKFLNFFKVKKLVENRCFLVERRSVINETATARIDLSMNGVVLERNFNPPGKINTPKNVNISWETISFNIHYPKDTVTTQILVKYSIAIQGNNDTIYTDENRIYFSIKDDGNTNIYLNHLKSKAFYLIKISAGSNVGFGPETDITAETSDKKGKKRKRTSQKYYFTKNI